MAKQAKVEVATPTFLQAFNLKAYQARYAGALNKPAFGRITPIPGYEGVLWGGELAWNLGSNFSRLYANYCLVFAIKEAEYAPSRPGMGIAGMLKEARAAGIFGTDLPEMNRSDWRAVLENHPQEDTEGGIGLSVDKLLRLLKGFSDNENHVEGSAYINDTRDTMLAVAELSRDYEKYKPISQRREAELDAHTTRIASSYQRAQAQAQQPVAGAVAAAG